MKKKITYGILTILFIVGIYFGLNFVFGLFTPFNIWTANQDIKIGKIQIVLLGELPTNYKQKQKLANDYGFDLYFYGCNISTSIINGTKYYNQTMVDHLENKNGASWWTRFQKQLDSIDKSNSLDFKIQKVSNLIGTLKIVKDKIKFIDSLSNKQRHVSLITTLNDTDKNIYLVRVCEDNGTNLITYFNFMVDENTMKIINKSGKLYGQ